MRRADPSIAVVALACGVSAFVCVVGGDLAWAAALGNVIVRHHAVPQGLPFSSADTHRWANVPVVAEVVLGRLYALLGTRGFLAAQLVAVAAAFELLRRAMLARGATAGGAAAALLLVLVGAFTSFVVVRMQLFSLAAFALLLAVLARPTRRALMVLPLLFCVWANLHGAVLVGLLVFGVYALFRLRTERTPLGILLASVAATCLTPALLRTPQYFHTVSASVAARRGIELWAGLSPASVADDLLIVCVIVLAVAAARARLSGWELATAGALAVATVHTARMGVWLVMFAAVPAARGLSRAVPVRARATAAVGALAFGAALVVAGLARGPIPDAATATLVAKARATAADTPVLAEGPLAEQLALAGGRIWLGDPLDAFSTADQRVYLDWVEGSPAGDAALAHATRVVLTFRGSPAEARLGRDKRFRVCGRDRRAVLFVRSGVRCS